MATSRLRQPALPRAGREVHGQAKAGRGRVIERPGVPQSSAVEQDHGARRRDDLHLVRVRAHPGRVAMLHVDRRLGAPVRTRDDAQRTAIPGERGHAPHGGQALPRPPGPAALAEVRVQALLARARDGGAQVDAAHVPGLTQHGAGRVGEQRLPVAGSETGVGQADLRHDAGLVHVQAGLAGPGRDRRADQLVEPPPDRAEGRLVDQRPHDQVALVLQEPALACGELRCGGHKPTLAQHRGPRNAFPPQHAAGDPRAMPVTGMLSFRPAGTAPGRTRPSRRHPPGR